MNQRDFNEENLKNCKEALEEIMKAIPKSKVVNFVGHFNDLFLFLNGCGAELKKTGSGKHE